MELGKDHVIRRDSGIGVASSFLSAMAEKLVWGLKNGDLASVKEICEKVHT